MPLRWVKRAFSENLPHFFEISEDFPRTMGKSPPEKDSPAPVYGYCSTGRIFCWEVTTCSHGSVLGRPKKKVSGWGWIPLPLAWKTRVLRGGLYQVGGLSDPHRSPIWVSDSAFDSCELPLSGHNWSQKWSEALTGMKVDFVQETRESLHKMKGNGSFCQNHPCNVRQSASNQLPIVSSNS